MLNMIPIGRQRLGHANVAAQHTLGNYILHICVVRRQDNDCLWSSQGMSLTCPVNTASTIDYSNTVSMQQFGISLHVTQGQRV